MSWGHGNVAAIGTSSLNSYAGVNFKSTLRLGDVHSEVPALKQNLRDYRLEYERYGGTDFNGVPSLSGNTSQTFDSATEANLKVFQQLEGLTQDGIYGQASRNRMMFAEGVSSVGNVRLAPYTSTYTNYNDTSSGMSADSTYKLDHSWLRVSAKSTLERLALDFKNATGVKLQINDCCLINDEDTPDHASHSGGKDADIRSTVMTTEQQKTFLQLCVNNSGVAQVLFGTNHGINSSKIVVRSDHADHFHVDFV
ncbi:peptidoglycan-binding protein [Brassicibacter mesophilus]|uniref:peptidoglycan-binding protein n=1 Tax=Brassicibacter mesophilus TaxID=745119 RepID=UPI003D22DDD5